LRAMPEDCGLGIVDAVERQLPSFQRHRDVWIADLWPDGEGAVPLPAFVRDLVSEATDLAALDRAFVPVFEAMCASEDGSRGLQRR